MGQSGPIRKHAVFPLHGMELATGAGMRDEAEIASAADGFADAPDEQAGSQDVSYAFPFAMLSR